MEKYTKSVTANGIEQRPENGYASVGEFLIESTPGTQFAVNHIDKNTARSLGGSGKRGVDDVPVNVQDSTMISPNKNAVGPFHQEVLKHLSKVTDNLNKAEKRANLSSLSKNTYEVTQREMPKLFYQTGTHDAIKNALRENGTSSDEYNCGKDRRYAEGKMSAFSRMFPTIAGLTAGLGQLAHWGTNPIQYHSTYATNPYGTRALNELNQLRYNPYPDIQASQEAERRAAYANSQAGGMTGSQKYMGRIGLGIGAMRNAANVFSNAQQQNNNYRTQYANALLQEGNSIASRRQNANQHDWSDYVAAHGAKTRGIEQSMSNTLGAINGGFQNEFKYRTWQDSLDIYRQQQQLDRQRLEADLNNKKAVVSVNTPRPVYVGGYNRYLPQYQLMMPQWQWLKPNGGLST